ncbi:hypothetical protein HA466_0295590 [Hirschfeldia incana]|nr:hypothetical protein HA466_0295590 [Hirschfeldia incana]KAJ0231906.1 hypothetical protein HA466_0295590 [Hirschfeldia incana]
MISKNKTNVRHLSISTTECEQSGDHPGGDFPNVLKSSIRSSRLTKKMDPVYYASPGRWILCICRAWWKKIVSILRFYQSLALG